MSMEVWKEIDGYNQRYEVSNYGRVRSKDMVVNGWLQNCHKIKGRILKPHTDKEGYKGVVLCINQKRKTFRLHRLVAAAFIPNPDNLPEITISTATEPITMRLIYVGVPANKIPIIQ